MPRVVRLILILVPLALVAAAVGLWVRNATRTTADPPPTEVQVKTETMDGITFEVEHEMKEGVNLFTSGGPGLLRFTRLGHILDYQYGLLMINEIGLPDLKPGDTVRWNLEGPVLLNGQPVHPHELQARSIEAKSFDGDWNTQPSPYPRDTLSLAWAGASRKLLVAHGDGVIRVWDADLKIVVKSMTPEPPKTGGKGSFGLRIGVSPDGNRVVAANIYGEETTVWDLEKDEKPVSFTGDPKAKVRQVGFVSNESFLEARGNKLQLRPLNGMAATVLGTVHEQFEPSFAVHAKSGLVAWSDGNKLHFGPIASPTFEWEPVAGGACFAFSADGSLLAAFRGDNRLSLLDPKTGKEVKRLRWRGRLGSADSIHALAFAPDGKTLAVGSSDNIRFYDVPTGRERGGLASPWVRDLAYSADGRTLAAGLHYQPGLRLWNAADLVAKKEP
jgi:hypothetical protein